MLHIGCVAGVTYAKIYFLFAFDNILIYINQIWHVYFIKSEDFVGLIIKKVYYQ